MFFDAYIGAPPTVTGLLFIVCANDGVVAVAPKAMAAAATADKAAIRSVFIVILTFSLTPLVMQRRGYAAAAPLGCGAAVHGLVKRGLERRKPFVRLSAALSRAVAKISRGG
jgi:hypothetical protein